MVFNVITIVLFVIDMALSCIAINGYAFSFLFWIDILSTVSIVLDIDAVQYDLIGFNFDLQDDYGQIESTEDVIDSKKDLQIIANSCKLTRIVRLIRLLRILRLYRSINKAQKEMVNRTLLQSIVKESNDAKDIGKSIKIQM